MHGFKNFQLANLYIVKVLSPVSWQFMITIEPQVNQHMPLFFGSPGNPSNINIDPIIRTLLSRQNYYS